MDWKSNTLIITRKNKKALFLLHALLSSNAKRLAKIQFEKPTD